MLGLRDIDVPVIGRDHVLVTPEAAGDSDPDDPTTLADAKSTAGAGPE
jgi:hypothetical protein